MLRPFDVLGPDQLIARRLPTYEHRPEQLAMADAVAAAIADKRHLVVEAGTGVGKSFAYLVPAILSLAARQETSDSAPTPKQPIIISTHTIALQEQLMSKDFPLLNSVIPLEFSAVLGKGRGNYLSQRRLKLAQQRGTTSLFEPAEIEQLRLLQGWKSSTLDGSRATLPFQVSGSVWDEVQSDNQNCLGRQCPTFQECFYYQARRRLQNADLIVVNHALFFTDLSLRQMGAALLPNYRVVVFDEAHTLEDVASDFLGSSVGKSQIEYTLNRLYNESTQKGLLITHNLSTATRLVVNCRVRTDEFFDDINSWMQRHSGRDLHSPKTLRVLQPLPIENQLSPSLAELARAISLAKEQCEDISHKVELAAAASRVQDLASLLESWRRQTLEDHVYWIERQAQRRRENLRLLCAPIDIGETLRQQLFNTTDTCVLTSATLSTGQKDFSFFSRRLGLADPVALQLGSPFNYADQAALIIVTNMADPASERELHQRQCIDAIRHYLLQSDGHAFVLFTSFDLLNKVARQLSSWFSDQKMPFFNQGDGTPRGQLLERFKQTPRSVLFGTDSFWQGVDVPGEALQNVIITKLPFSVPDHPLLEARLDRIREQGGIPFRDYQLPEAIIKFKQGFGRLIRTATDRGTVVVLDPRIRTKPYGKDFLAALPPCPVRYETL